jgi:hypothetical protein
MEMSDLTFSERGQSNTIGLPRATDFMVADAPVAPSTPMPTAPPQSLLFETEQASGAATDEARPVGPFAGVALDQRIDRVLDYSIPPRFAPVASSRAGREGPARPQQQASARIRRFQFTTAPTIQRSNPWRKSMTRACWSAAS